MPVLLSLVNMSSKSFVFFKLCFPFVFFKALPTEKGDREGEDQEKVKSRYDC